MNDKIYKILNDYEVTFERRTSPLTKSQVDQLLAKYENTPIRDLQSGTDGWKILATVSRWAGFSSAIRAAFVMDVYDETLVEGLDIIMYGRR